MPPRIGPIRSLPARQQGARTGVLPLFRGAKQHLGSFAASEEAGKLRFLHVNIGDTRMLRQIAYRSSGKTRG
jgi:hypothetical protein